MTSRPSEDELVALAEREIIDAVEAQFDIHSMDPEDWAEMSCEISRVLNNLAARASQRNSNDTE